MELQDISKNCGEKKKGVSARLTEEDFDYIKENNINISNLIHIAIEELKSGR